MSSRPSALSRRQFLLLAGCAAASLAAPTFAQPTITSPTTAKAPTGLAGEYGFLSCAALGPQSGDSIRSRIATMVQEFGITDFQFYDWFADYSTPTAGQAWTDPYFHRLPVSRRTIQISIDQIHRQRGRAWAYVQSVASEQQNLENPRQDIWKLRDRKGNWYWHPPGAAKPRFPTYFANAAWGKYMTSVWAPAVKDLGFDGIHWDTLGRIAGDYAAETAGFHAFIQTAKPLLDQLGLRQTMNMVDMAWWDRAVIRDCLEFPYVESWSADTADRYYAQMDWPYFQTTRGVIAMYPSTAAAPGQTPTEIIRARHDAAQQHHLSYLIVGDGARRMKNEYWPNTAPLSAAEIAFLRTKGS